MSNYCSNGHWEDGMKLPCKQCEIEQLQARVAELEAENARLNRSNSSYASLTKAQESQLTNLRQRLYQLKGADSAIDSEREANNMLTEQLAAAQTEIKRLRKHTECNKRIKDSVDKLLEMAGYHVESSSRHQLGLMNFDCIAQPSDTSALDAYVAEKEKEIIESHAPEGRNVTNAQHVEMRQKFLDQIATLTRQRDLAVEALDWCVAEINRASPAAINGKKALSTIKESEVK